MAKLTDEVVNLVFKLQKMLLEILDKATETEYRIFEQFGETEATFAELEELQNIRERADSGYTRFSVILRRIYLSQPAPFRANLDLLNQTIEEADASIAALEASIQEIKANWNLL